MRTTLVAVLMILAVGAFAQEKYVGADNDEAVVQGAWDGMKKMGGLNTVVITCERRAGVCVEVRVWDSPATGPCSQECGRFLETSTDVLRITSWTPRNILAEDAGSCHFLSRTLVILLDENNPSNSLAGSATETMNNSTAKGCKNTDKDPFMPLTWILGDQATEKGAR